MKDNTLADSTNRFNWYKSAVVCVAHLSDVEHYERYDPYWDDSHWHEAFKASEWLTRGWTLQELLAPQRLRFVSKNWTPLGYGSTQFDKVLSVASSVHTRLLRGFQPGQQPFSRTMS